MAGHLSFILHAHLPWVRHPEHDRFLEESWLFEAITECYLPLVQMLEGWVRDRVPARLTLTLSPTLCSMLQDELLRTRYQRHLEQLLELANHEIHRTHWDRSCHNLAWMYRHRFTSLRESWLRYNQDLVAAFRGFQDRGLLEIITCAATHALLPILDNPESVRAQILTARDHYRSCFGRDPQGIWLPECAYTPELDTPLRDAGLRWFLLDSHGLLHATPKPRHGVFAPIFTPAGLAAFGRDQESARQVWSRHEGYPGDLRYRDFYRDIGFDLDMDYVRPCLPDPNTRGFTGIKYHRIAGTAEAKEVYDRDEALRAAEEHAAHFLSTRVDQFRRLNPLLDTDPVVLCPYDAELFGHWWYEGPHFIDQLFRKATQYQDLFRLSTPSDVLATGQPLQVSQPAASSWGDQGFFGIWLDETNIWMQQHLQVAQERMTTLVRRHAGATGLTQRALQQAGRELLLAQSSDWPFILRTGTSPDYARNRFTNHILRFLALHEQLTLTRIDEAWLQSIEATDNLFPDLNPAYWA